jgi:hypothetical protein
MSVRFELLVVSDASAVVITVEMFVLVMATLVVMLEVVAMLVVMLVVAMPAV